MDSNTTPYIHLVYAKYTFIQFVILYIYDCGCTCNANLMCEQCHSPFSLSSILSLFHETKLVNICIPSSVDIKKKGKRIKNRIICLVRIMWTCFCVVSCIRDSCSQLGNSFSVFVFIYFSKRNQENKNIALLNLLRKLIFCFKIKQPLDIMLYGYSTCLPATH